MPQPDYAARDRARANRKYQQAVDKLFGREYTRKGSTGRTKAALSPEDQAFLNDPRNAEFREQYIRDYGNTSFSRYGHRSNATKRGSFADRINQRRGELAAQDFFAANPRPSFNVEDIQNMIAQQRGATLAGIPTVEGFGQGVLPMLQGGFQAPMSPPVFGQGGGMFAGGPQISQGVLGNLATQGMGQMGAGQTMNPTIFRGKV